MAQTRRPIWLDCDPGHDDAIAILLAVHCPNIQLLGVSTTHGNASPSNTHQNAVRLLHAFDAPVDVHACRGAIKPLIRPVRSDPEIHGEDGLGGVDGLPSMDHPGVMERWNLDGRRPATDGMAKAVKNTYLNGAKVSIVTTGPMTNLAIFLTLHPELYDAIEEIVFMGGGVGLGNRSAVAEFNILCDPEAAQIVLDCPIKKTMIPLNVTHTCIFTSPIHHRLLTGSGPNNPQSPSEDVEELDSVDMPPARTPLRHMLSTLILFFASTYKSVFGFTEGPPLHDALTIAYLSQPEIFETRRYRVDVELAGTHTVGETVVDLWDYQGLPDDDWGVGHKNCLVAEAVDVNAFFEIVLTCVDKCDKVSSLNLQ